MGMSDKQYDGVLLNFIEDFEDIEELVELLPDSPEKEKILAKIEQKKKKTERMLETPAAP